MSINNDFTKLYVPLNLWCRQTETLICTGFFHFLFHFLVSARLATHSIMMRFYILFVHKMCLIALLWNIMKLSPCVGACGALTKCFSFLNICDMLSLRSSSDCLSVLKVVPSGSCFSGFVILAVWEAEQPCRDLMNSLTFFGWFFFFSLLPLWWIYFVR